MIRISARSGRIFHLTALILSILPAIAIIYLITQNWVNVPWIDQWNTPGSAFIKIHEGNLTLDYWTSQHNESRPLVYRLISVPLAFLTNWDVRYEITLMILVACGISLCIYRLIRLSCGRDDILQLFVFFLINLLIFSPIQVDNSGNWLMGIQVIIFLVVFCIALCVVISYSGLNIRLKFFSCASLSLISTFTFANGILCWIVVLPPLLVLSASSWKEMLDRRTLVLAWVVCFSLTLYVYFHDYVNPRVASNPMEFLTQPTRAILLFLSILGSPLGFKSLVASQFVGLGLLCVFTVACAYLIRFCGDYVLVQKSVGWLSFSAYSLISAVLVTVGRLGHGNQTALLAKYTTASLYFAVSVIGLVYVAVSHARSRDSTLGKNRLLRNALILMVISGLTLHSLSFSKGAEWMKWTRLHLLAGKACLLWVHVMETDSCIDKYVYPLIQTDHWNSVNFVQDAVVTLDNMGLFSPSLITTSGFRATDSDQTSHSRDGLFERLTLVSSGRYIATGTIRIHQNQSIGGVVLAYGDQNNTTVFSFSDLVLAAPLNLTSKSAEMIWRAEFSVKQLPRHPVWITAWAVDTDTGKLFELERAQPEFKVSG